MPDKFNLTIRGSIRAHLTKRELAYQVFAEAIQRKITLDRLADIITSKHLVHFAGTIRGRRPHRAFVALPGHLSESQFIRKATENFKGSVRPFRGMRWFTAGAKLIYTEGQTVVFTNQWGESTIKMVSAMVNEMNKRDISVELAST